MNTKAGDIYLKNVFAESARMLSLQDREQCSKTYGCFDRNFWGWKFTDFPGARFQEGVYALSYLYTQPSDGNPFYKNSKLLDWIKAGFRYWQGIQYRDGSFDEAYPYEHSLAATAFTLFYLGEAYLLAEAHLTGEEQNSVKETSRRAAEWLCENDEYHGILSNHLAVAAASLCVISRILDNPKYMDRCQYFLDKIYAHQSAEGWYEEYGGADPGYQTHGTFYLARIWEYTKAEKLLSSLAKSIEFLKCFFHPNGTLGGEYGSRNTEFYFPAGFEILAPVVPDAALIAGFMRPSVSNQKAAGLRTMDSYNFFPLLNNYLFSASAAGELASPEGVMPCAAEGEWKFPDAGMIVKNTASYYAVLGASKGGVLKVYDRETGTLALSDCGYWVRLQNGVAASNQSLCRPVQIGQDGNTFTIKASFVKIPGRTMNPYLFLCFRLFTLSLGRFKSVALWVKNILVKVLVQKKKSVGMEVIRNIKFTESAVQIVDTVTSAKETPVDAFRRDSKFATVHMGSSRYFQYQELEPQADETQPCVDELNKNGRVEIKKTVQFSSQKSKEAI